MEPLTVALASALWLGLLTSISPCPLATNVAAMSFIGRRVGNARLVVLTGLVYTLGRMVAYVALGMLLVAGLLSIPQLSYTLQHGVAKLVGPLLILIGMVLLELVTIPAASLPFGESLRRRAESWGVAGAGVLGLIFAPLILSRVGGALFREPRPTGGEVRLAASRCLRYTGWGRVFRSSSSPCSSPSGLRASAGRFTP